MDRKSETDVIEYSVAINEIVGKPPSWVIKYASYLIIGLLTVIVILISIIQYNDVVEGKILMSTENPIVTLKAKTSGEIARLFVKNGDTVYQGQVLAALKTTASYKDIIKVKQVLLLMQKQETIDINSVGQYYPSNLRLGDLQEKYLEFFIKHNEYLAIDSLNPFQNKNKNVAKQLENHKKVLSSKQRQLNLTKRKVDISTKKVKRSETLLNKGVIAQQDFDEIQKQHLGLLNEVELLIADIYQKKIALNEMDALINEATLIELRYGTSNNRIYKESFQSIKNEIENWENQNLIIAPINGIANSHNVWEKYQNVLEGDIIFSIVPQIPGLGVGIVEIPIMRFSKLRKGQSVIIKLTSYPFQQYGHLTGTVTGMSSVPNQKKQSYTVFVEINNLETSHGYKIKLNQQMMGRAQIITEKLSLANRLFYSFRKIIDPNE